jgi:hypothetical protein
MISVDTTTTITTTTTTTTTYNNNHIKYPCTVPTRPILDLSNTESQVRIPLFTWA